MARIRSIHPGLWTDEDFAGVSMPARLLYLGILTEADDHGVFEWKPVGLKMRIFPADKIDVEPLMLELIGVNKISRAPGTEDKLGVVRNFCKFQRPKKPTYRFSLPPESRTYVGLSDDGSEPVGNQYGTGGEIAPQMEEEGGNRKGNKQYAFENGIIRLSEKDFTQWKSSFQHLDLQAELIGLTAWAEQQGPRRWFAAVSGALAKRNREARERDEKNKNQPGFKYNGKIEGVI